MSKKLEDLKLYKTEMFISYVLRYGVLICAAVIGVGLLLKLIPAHGPVTNSDADLLSQLTNGKWIPREHGSGILSDKIVNYGVVLLIALPIVRVGMTIFLFLFERDWIYVVITMIVFATLLSSVFMKLAI